MVNLSDIKGGMDKLISPQQQKRASRVLEGLWGAVASPSAVAAASARKEKKKSEREQVHLLDCDDDVEGDETIMPSRSSQFTVMIPDNKEELDLSITASPSGYLTSNHALSTPPIKEDRETEESSEDGWNW